MVSGQALILPSPPTYHFRNNIPMRRHAGAQESFGSLPFRSFEQNEA